MCDKEQALFDREKRLSLETSLVGRVVSEGGREGGEGERVGEGERGRGEGGRTV